MQLCDLFLAHIKDRARGKVGRSHTFTHILSLSHINIRIHINAKVGPIPIAPDTPVTPWKGQHIYTVTRPDL